MLRDKNLIPLSHQHQKMLALCVRIDRAQPIPAADLPAWREEMAQLFENEIQIHFAAEEEIVFRVAREVPELRSLADELTNDHILLRQGFGSAESRQMAAEALPAFAQQLSAHIRKEERQLFERMQKLLSPEELARVGVLLESALRDAGRSCLLGNEATKLRPRS
jgi:hemerythrin superfamily protein